MHLPRGAEATGENEKRHSVIVADDDEEIRQELVLLLCKDYELVGVAANGRELVHIARDRKHSLYERIPPVNFSHQVLSAEPGRLLVLRLNDVGWSDLGDPGRAFMAARGSSCESGWARDWEVPKLAAIGASEKTTAFAQDFGKST